MNKEDGKAEEQDKDANTKEAAADSKIGGANIKLIQNVTNNYIYMDKKEKETKKPAPKPQRETDTEAKR